MPIYEYQTADARNSCPKCINSFEAFQNIDEKPFSRCPSCGNRVKKVISWCRAAIVEIPEASLKAKEKIRNFENEGMWSHAAELAEKHSEYSSDKNLKLRALDNYVKAGHDVDTFANHDNLNS